jgi:hypothetical protein
MCGGFDWRGVSDFAICRKAEKPGEQPSFHFAQNRPTTRFSRRGAVVFTAPLSFEIGGKARRISPSLIGTRKVEHGSWRG